MNAIPSASADHAPASAQLADLYLYYHQKFSKLSSPRSVAEIEVSEADLRQLVEWFSCLYGKPRNWCERDYVEDLGGGVFASEKEMFGALLIILGAEVCREGSREDAVWPTVAAVLRADRNSFPALFAASNQPSELTKGAISAGAKRLGLRNLIDRYGTQEYFDTLKLQFGFTAKGAKARLSEWLIGLGVPMAVRILRGDEGEYVDLKSESFCQLWKTLKEFRQGRRPREYARAVICQSPWVRPHWADDLLDVATRSVTGSGTLISTPSEARSRESEAVQEPLLKWEWPSKPRIQLQLDEDYIQELVAGCDAHAVDFVVDNRRVARWIAQNGGYWAGPRKVYCEPDSHCSQPNLRPKVLTISGTDGQQLIESDLSTVGLDEPLLIFDLRTGSLINEGTSLESARDYGLICDSDLVVEGCSQFLNIGSRKAYHLSSPRSGDLRVLCQGAVYWEPATSTTVKLAQERLTLTAQSGALVDVGSPAYLDLFHVPADATEVSILIGRSTYQTVRVGERWSTVNRVPLSLELGIGIERVRVRVSRGGGNRAFTPRLAFRLRGLAVVETDHVEDSQPHWKLINQHQVLNLGGGSGRARIFVQEPDTPVFEGPRLIAKAGSRTLPLRDFLGWGWPLILGSEPNDTLAQSVEDRGCIALYCPALFGKPIHKILLRTPINPGDGHMVHLWSDLGNEPKNIPGKDIGTNSDGRVWALSEYGKVTALAISFRGACLGAYWDSPALQSVFSKHVTLRTLALARWLKLPVLSATFSNAFSGAVHKSPSAFAQAWLRDEGLPPGLTFRQADAGVLEVARWHLWNYSESNPQRVESLVRIFQSTGSVTAGDAFVSAITRISELCPPLAYRVARSMVRGKPFVQYARRAVADLLRIPLPSSASDLVQTLSSLRGDCARLLRMDEGTLDACADSIVLVTERGIPPTARLEEQSRYLAETDTGRRFLSAKLLLDVVERRRG